MTKASKLHAPSADAFDLFIPSAGADERALRRRIDKALLVSTERVALERNLHARDLYSLSFELARRWVFRPVNDVGDLERILWALNQQFMAAGHISVVEGSDGD